MEVADLEGLTWAAWVPDQSRYRGPNREERIAGHRDPEVLEHAFVEDHPKVGDRPICKNNVPQVDREREIGSGYLRRCKTCVKISSSDIDRPITWPAKSGNGWLLRMPPHAAAVGELKEAIPKDDRNWYPKRRRWWFKSKYVDRVKEIMERHFEEVAWPRRGR